MHNWSKYVLALNRIEPQPTKVKLSKKQKEGSEASPTKQPASNLDINSRTSLSPSQSPQRLHPIPVAQ
jgi:hypothetical protein